MLDLGKEEEVDAQMLMLELLDFVDDVVDELGSRREIDYISYIMQNGTSAQRQLAVYEKTNDLHQVVDQLLKEVVEGI